jgi:MFS transporter, YQGE family, putative transporter
MRKFIDKELAELGKLSQNARDLLKSFFLFEIFTVIADLFIGAYIFQKQDSVLAVALYYLGNFTMIPFFFYVNGYLLKRVSVLKLFLLGTVLQAISPLILVAIPEINAPILLLLGGMFGVGMAFYWANRNYLTIDSTTDEDRNFFFGINSSAGTIAQILAPVVIGLVIKFFSENVFESQQMGYIISMFIGLMITLSSVWILRDNNFHKPDIKSLRPKNVSFNWRLLMLATSLNNMRQGMMIFFPSMIILLLVGGEDKLGGISSLVSIISAIFTYSLGRKIKAANRIIIYLIASVIFTIGTITLIVDFSVLGVIAFMICLRLANPNFYAGMSGFWFKYINLLKGKDESNYTYLCDPEIYIALGRLVGIGLLLGFVHFMGQEDGLRFIAVIFPVSQLIILGIIRHLENQGPTGKPL